MVAAAAINFLDLGCSAVLAEADHQGFVEQAALVEIIEEACEGLVEAGEEFVFHAGEVIPVCIPACACEAVFIPEDADKAAACLDEAAGSEGGLAEKCFAVAFAGLDWFFAEVESIANAVGAKQIERGGTLAAHGRSAWHGFELGLGLVELLSEA